MHTIKIECITCGKGYSGETEEQVFEIARLHAQNSTHPTPVKYRFVSLETFTLVVDSEEPDSENPDSENPDSENPDSENPDSGDTGPTDENDNKNDNKNGDGEEPS